MRGNIRIEIDGAAMRRMERDIARKTDAAVKRGEKAAEGKGPVEVAEAVAAELRKIGVKPNIEVLRAEYRKLMK